MTGIPDNRYLKIDYGFLRRTDLTPIQKLVFATINDRIGKNGEAWPSMETIANDLGVERKTVLRAIKVLKKKKFLKVKRFIRRFDDGTVLQSNSYSKGKEPLYQSGTTVENDAEYQNGT